MKTLFIFAAELEEPSVMNDKHLHTLMGFSSKENVRSVFVKNYLQNNNFEVNLERNTIDYDNLNRSENKTTQNCLQPENFVVLECVNRLLEKGYQPRNIILEKTYPAGHGTSGRADICVTRDDGSEYMLIECKTYGEEFDKAFARMKKDGGQLFTYFKFSNKPDIIMLYASKLTDSGIVYRNEIVKIEDDYRTGDVKDFCERWNKLTKDSGVFDEWAKPYDFEIKKFTKDNLRELTGAEGNKLFNGFASILRKHSVSDKPNAFNVIFNLFLAKLYDEAKPRNKELDFHWRENEDPVDFQVRLYNLHKEGLLAFLKKEIEGISDRDFNAETVEELKRAKKKFLKFNKLFDIKSVFDDDDFEQNHRVLKEVVQLIEKYQIRYPHKQRHLSEFFELLLTTGLKQEAGQYFTPPPIAKFITKSLPLQAMVEKAVNNAPPQLPAAIDYAAGSGHFITEIMEEYQDIINKLKPDEDYPDIAAKELKGWKVNPYSWAAKYIYGIEKDYRLVKVAKVGCYFYGDGPAQIIHGDGLDSFKGSKSYVDLLKDNAASPQFSVVVSNPPYSVNDCKDDLEYIGSQHDFTLYPILTDKSREIEVLFVERTAQLLKDGGVAGIILPSSILSNTGIYTKAREIILQRFEIVAIAKFGSNTFMETGTNTVVLFLRRRNDAEVQRIREAAYRLAEGYPKTHEDLTVNGIEEPVQKYLDRTKQTEINPEKLFYFILAYPQKNIVIINSGEKDDEKRFLGYKFSDTRGSEGMHPVNGRSTIEECTKLYDSQNYNNPQRASTYIYNAFGKSVLEIDDSLKQYIKYAHLADMLIFDSSSFEKQISLGVTKKVKIDTKWDNVEFSSIATITRGVTYSKGDRRLEPTENIVLTADNITLDGHFEVKKEVFLYADFDVSDEKRLRRNDIFMCFSSGSKAHLGKVAFIENDTHYLAGGFMGIIRAKENILPKYLFQLLNSILRQSIRDLGAGSNINNLSSVINSIHIPLPPLETQQTIVSETEVLEGKELDAKEKIKKFRQEISEKMRMERKWDIVKLGDVIELIAGQSPDSKFYNQEKRGLPFYQGKKEFGEIYLQTPVVWTEKITKTAVLGDVLMTVRAPVGPVNMNPFEKICIGRGLNVLRATEKILNKYLFYYLQQNQEIITGDEGTVFQSISRDGILTIPIPLPPLEIQQKIVSEIEKIEARIAEAEKIIADMPAKRNEILNKYL
jgi:type I restriction enzyme M protein